MSNGTTTPDVFLLPQTGMPPLVQSKSQEIIYDTLEQDARFIKNPYGPAPLYLSRAQFIW